MGFEAGVGGVAFNVADRAFDVGRGVEEDLPGAVGPAGSGGGAGGLLEGVEALGEELLGGATLEVAEDSAGVVGVVACDDDMDVVGHDGQGVQGVAGRVDDVGDALSGGAGLLAGEADGRVLEVLLGGAALSGIVRAMGEGVGGVGFGRGAGVAIELVRVDEVGPRAARVVGEPEAVCPEDAVEGKHREVRVAVSRRA